MKTRTSATLAALLSVGALAGCSDGEAPDEGRCGTGAIVDTSFRAVVTDDLVISADGSQVAADSYTGLTRWKTSDGSIQQIDPRSLVATSPDFSLAVEARDGARVLVDTETDDVTAELSDAPCDVGDIAFNHNGTAIAAVGDKGGVTIWDVETGKVESEIDAGGSGAGANTVAISPDGTKVATGGETEIMIYDIESGDALHTFTGSGEGSVAVVWSPDGRFIAGAGSADAVTVWDTETFERVAETEGDLEQMTFAPDSTSLAFTVRDQTAVRLWTPPGLGGSGGTVPVVRVLEGHTQPPGALVFANDGRTLYTIAETDYVLAWDVDRAAPAKVKFEQPPRD